MNVTGTVQRVYTGTRPVVFMTGNVGEVRPGQEFTVPRDLAARFDARGDVAEVRRRRRTGARPDGTADSAAPDGAGRDGDQDQTTDPGSRAE